MVGRSAAPVRPDVDESEFFQVNGVDEADLVKSDGEYLYIAQDRRLSIIDARNPAELSLAAEIPLDSYVSGLFVSGDRLVLLSNRYTFVSYRDAIDVGAWFPSIYGAQTSVAIYDIADRTSPTLIQKTTIDGNLTASRRIDDLVYAITPDASVRLQKLTAGECHVMPYPNPADIESIRNNASLKLLEQEGLNVGYLAFNTEKAPFTDKRVRQALNMAVNK